MKLVFSIFLIAFAYQVNAQTKYLVDWQFTSRTKGDTIEIVMTAQPEPGWHIYSQFLVGEGPVPTTFEYHLPKGMNVVGKTKEPQPIKYFDENFGMDVLYFNSKVEFIQPIIGKSKKEGAIIKGKVNYMICNDQMCYPPTDVPFEIKL